MAHNCTFSLDIGWKTLRKDAGLEPEQIHPRMCSPVPLKVIACDRAWLGDRLCDRIILSQTR